MSFKIFLDKLTSNKSKLDTIDLNDYKEDLTQNDYMDILEFISKFRSRFIKFNDNQNIQVERSEFKERIDCALEKNFGVCGLRYIFEENFGDIYPRDIPTIYVPRKGLVWKKMPKRWQDPEVKDDYFESLRKLHEEARLRKSGENCKLFMIDLNKNHSTTESIKLKRKFSLDLKTSENDFNQSLVKDYFELKKLKKICFKE